MVMVRKKEVGKSLRKKKRKEIVGLEYDEELEELVSLAMESSEKAMDLEGMARGVMALYDWRKKNA